MATIQGFLDARELADIIDARASSVRALVNLRSDLIPPPVYLFDSMLPVWPVAAIDSWSKQGFCAGFSYDADEFTAAAVGGHHDGLASFVDPVTRFTEERERCKA